MGIKILKLHVLHKSENFLVNYEKVFNSAFANKLGDFYSAMKWGSIPKNNNLGKFCIFRFFDDFHVFRPQHCPGRPTILGRVSAKDGVAGARRRRGACRVAPRGPQGVAGCPESTG